MFLWVPHSWLKAFSPERDRMPSSCFCGQTHWEPGLLPLAGALLHLWPCSLAFHLGEFLMLLFLFDSVLFMSSLMGGKGYLSPQCSIGPCDVSWLAAAQQFWNTFTAGEKPVRMWREVLEDTHLRREESGQGCQWGKESLGRSWECWTKIEIHQGTNEWGLDCRILG